MMCMFIFSFRSYVLNGACSRKPTLLIVAASFSQFAILQFLLQKGANPNLSDVLFFVLLIKF